MFETIVWATDGSEPADRALPLVTELATVHGSRIVAVHANELVAGRYSGAPLVADQEELQAKIERQVAELREAGFTAAFEVKARAGQSLADLIVEAATDVKADLIVVGTHGRGAAVTALLGSVAKDLLHVAPCPVLVVTPERVAATADAVG